MGWLAAFGLLLSVPLWRQMVAVNGLPLMMVLALAIFRCWWQVEQALTNRRQPWAWLAGHGAGCALLFLTEYSAGVLGLVALGYVAWRTAGSRRWPALGVVAGAFLLIFSPWLWRNQALTGYPTALAWQNVALKEGDPTASPTETRATLSAALPRVDLNKLGNKLLTYGQTHLSSRLWSDGAMWFLAFFAVSWLYRFRQGETDRMRWMFTLALAVLLVGQGAFNSGESERLVTAWLCPLIIILGAGFFFVLVGSNPALARGPVWCALALLVLQALPLLRDGLEPLRLHFSYPPYYPRLFMGLKEEMQRRDQSGRFGVMADVPAGVFGAGEGSDWKRWGDLGVTGEMAPRSVTPWVLERPPLPTLGLFRHVVLRSRPPGSALRTETEATALVARLTAPEGGLALAARPPEPAAGIKVLPVSTEPDGVAFAPTTGFCAGRTLKIVVDEGGFDPSFRSLLCGCSSVGRAPPCQGGRREFESLRPLHFVRNPGKLTTYRGFSLVIFGSGPKQNGLMS